MTFYGVDGSNIKHTVDCCPTLRGQDYRPLRGAEITNRKPCKRCGPLHRTVLLLNRAKAVLVCPGDAS